jgi:hypothetical protein
MKRGTKTRKPQAAAKPTPAKIAIYSFIRAAFIVNLKIFGSVEFSHVLKAKMTQREQKKMDISHECPTL